MRKVYHYLSFKKAILAKILEKLHYKRSIDTYSHKTVTK